MSGIESSINDTTLQQHIDHVAAEIFNTTGARVLASASGIADGIVCPVELYMHCLRLIGNGAIIKGYFDGARWCDEPEDDEPHDTPFEAFEAHFALQTHFGEHWLSKALAAHFDRPENAVDDVGREVREKIKAAHARYDAARREHMVARLSGLVDQLETFAKEGQGLLREIRELQPLAA